MSYTDGQVRAQQVLGLEKTGAVKLAVGQRTFNRITAALSRQPAAAGTNYGAGWRQLGAAAQRGPLTKEVVGRIFAPGQNDLRNVGSRLTARERLRDWQTERRLLQEDPMYAYRKANTPEWVKDPYATFKPNPASDVPLDVQRGQHLASAVLRRHSAIPDEAVKLRAGVPLHQPPVTLPPALRDGRSLGPADAPDTRLWRASGRELRPANPDEATWTSGHFDVSHSYAEPGSLITAYRAESIPTGHFAGNAKVDTRKWTAEQAAAARAVDPTPYFERVVNSSDLDPRLIESQYVQGRHGVYHRRGVNLFPQSGH